MIKPTYILIKNIGRGCANAPYHELASDGSNPRCGTHIKGAQWQLVPAALRTRYRPCSRCQQLQEAP